MNTGQDEEPLPSTGTREQTRRSSAADEIKPQKKPIFERLEPTSRIWWINESGKTSTAYNRSYNFDYLACEEVASLMMEISLKMQKPSTGKKNHRSFRTRGSRTKKNRSEDQTVPARTILKKSSLPGDISRRSHR
ncbi:unnamed protein product [Brassica napus]|uniref:(rape) hypothetical protein n=1 Tax=Brassica napus TaxID=3708 RepID=A0A816X0D5_BRANA|nr:unnamed protein product [Brassica napus]